MHDIYDEDYFIRGKETGKSLYENYRFLPELTRPMAAALVKYLRITPADRILDFGCARGYLVRVLREFGFAAYGYDVSRWAIQHGDGPTVPYLTNTWEEVPQPIHWIMAKDVLEHLTPSELHKTLILFREMGANIFIAVPVAHVIHDRPVYIVPEYELDVTHQIRKTYDEWLELCESIFPADEWQIHATTRVRGVKDNYYLTHPTGNMFITIKRL